MKQLIVLPAVLLLTFAVSCQTPKPGASGPVHEVYRSLEPGTMVVDGALEVVDAQLVEPPGYKGCTIQLVNRSGSDVNVIGLIRWYEKDGAEARRGRPAWRRMALQPGQAVNLASIAPVPWCTGFGLELRSAAR